MNHVSLTNEHLTRQMDLIPSEVLDIPITVIGAGAIGSFTTLQLVKMGFTNLEVWDHDVVSVENMSCQFYRFKDIGNAKVDALRSLVKEFTNEDITVIADRFNLRADHKGIILCAVDSMEVRRATFEAIQARAFQVTHFIDPRMGAESALLYCMNPFEPKDHKAYNVTLYSDTDAVQERCTAKATIYTANLLSGLVAKTVKNIACGQAYPRVSTWNIADNALESWTSN